MGQKLTPTAECFNCGHGRPIPPANCFECGGVYGQAPEHPLRCRQCNDNLIALAIESQQWIASLAVTTTIAPGQVNDIPGATTITINPGGNCPPGHMT
jgi:hypothetical protein